MNLQRARPPLWLEWGLLGLLIGLYLFIGTRQIARPGLWWDEGDTAAYGMELALDLPRSETDWSVRLAGRTWPLRVQHPYDFTALPIYWSAFAFKALGVSVFVLRLSAVILGAAVLAVFYALCRLWLGTEAAFAAGLLLAVNPAFALMSRLGYWALEIPLALPTLAALAFLSLWHRQRRAWALCAGAFCWGLSTSVTTKAVAFLIAYPVLYLAFVPRKDRPSPRLIAATAACAALGASDFIAFNAARGMPIFRYLLGALAAPTRSGVENLAVARNLALRGRQILELLDGSASAGENARSEVLLIFFAAAFAAMVWRCSSRERFRGRGFVLLVLGMIVLLFIESAFTPEGLDCQHLLVLLPYVVLSAAASLDWLRTEVERRLPGKGTLAAALLLALPVVSSLRVDASYFSRLEIMGGEGFSSDAIYDLAGYLDNRAIRVPICFNYGISRNTYLITAGRVNPIDRRAFRAGELAPKLLQKYAELAADPAAHFISQTGHTGAPAREYFDYFRGVVERAGRRLVIERQFPDSQGRPVFIVWAAARRP